jgi:hypothetical protein
VGTNYSQKLEKLRQRRAPTNLAKSLTAGLAFDSADFKPKVESFESKGKGDATRYALGCMAEVPPEYTEISLRDGQRISDQLAKQTEYDVLTRLQGSVPLNIHIYTSSDVDLLVIAKWFLTVETPVVPPNTYYFRPDLSAPTELGALRAFCEGYLTSKYPAADVDVSGAKSIAVSGGSLARKVDVVPAHWVDTSDYQQTKDEKFRDVSILNKSDRSTLTNRPFLHMALIEQKDITSEGQAKRAIRLLKCLSRDADVDIKLSSYDIAGLIYHMHDENLKTGPYFPLQLLNRVEEYLRYLEANPYYATLLRAPDDTRPLLDSAEKVQSLAALRQELTDTIDSVAAEYNTGLSQIFDRARAAEAARKTLKETFIL